MGDGSSGRIHERIYFSPRPCTPWRNCPRVRWRSPVDERNGIRTQLACRHRAWIRDTPKDTHDLMLIDSVFLVGLFKTMVVVAEIHRFSRQTAALSHSLLIIICTASAISKPSLFWSAMNVEDETTTPSKHRLIWFNCQPFSDANNWELFGIWSLRIRDKSSGVGRVSSQYY